MRLILARAAWMQATATSLKAGLLTSLFATPLGIARGLRTVGFALRWARLASALLLTPIIVPVILVGIAIFYAYVKLKLVNTLARPRAGAQRARDPAG